MNRLVFCSPVRLQLGCLNFRRLGECIACESPVAWPSYVVGGQQATLQATHLADLRLINRPILSLRPAPYRAGRGRWQQVAPARPNPPGVTVLGESEGGMGNFAGQMVC